MSHSDDQRFSERTRDQEARAVEALVRAMQALLALGWDADDFVDELRRLVEERDA